MLVSDNLVFRIFKLAATTYNYTLSLHDALPISAEQHRPGVGVPELAAGAPVVAGHPAGVAVVHRVGVAADHPGRSAAPGALPQELVLVVDRRDAAAGVRDAQDAVVDVQPVDVDLGGDPVGQAGHLAGQVVDVAVVAAGVDP